MCVFFFDSCILSVSTGQSSSGSGITSGAKAGVVIGCILGVTCFGVASAWGLRIRRMRLRAAGRRPPSAKLQAWGGWWHSTPANVCVPQIVQHMLSGRAFEARSGSHAPPSYAGCTLSLCFPQKRKRDGPSRVHLECLLEMPHHRFVALHSASLSALQSCSIDSEVLTSSRTIPIS